MKHFVFYRESNDFDDILKDKNIIQPNMLKISWKNHLLLGWPEEMPQHIETYIRIIYSQQMVKLTDKDYAPIPGVDYTPKK